LERLKRRKEEEKFLAHARPTGSIIANFSVPQYLDGYGIMRGMGMSSEVQLPVSKKNTVVVGGNLVVNGTDGTGAASAVLRHQLSSVASVEFMAYDLLSTTYKDTTSKMACSSIDGFYVLILESHVFVA
jgi:DnaJ family protein C protein 11